MNDFQPKRALGYLWIDYLPFLGECLKLLGLRLMEAIADCCGCDIQGKKDARFTD
jgi:hypothetical protein